MPAAALDAADPLARFAARFHLPADTLYLDGNSLGLCCDAAEAALLAALTDWKRYAVRGWTAGEHPWFGLSREVAALLAPLLGAEADDVMVGQSTTVNLHQLLATFADPAGRVLLDRTAFPSDRYAVESFLRPHGGEVVLVRPGPNRLLSPDAVAAAFAGARFAVLPAVVYTTGQLLDLAGLTAAARRHGCTVAWDCSHSAGVVPHRLREDGIDLAFGCTYKHLNGGPGAVGWLYVHPRLRDRPPGLAGWFGSDPARQFDMADTLYPAADAHRYLIGTPHVFSLAPLVGSLRVVAEAGVERIRAKSLAQTQFLRERVEDRLSRYGVTVVTPARDADRGGHLSLAHPLAGRVSAALRARGVVPDFRPPDLLRLAPAPLYTSFAECDRAVAELAAVFADLDRLPENADAVT